MFVGTYVKGTYKKPVNITIFKQEIRIVTRARLCAFPAIRSNDSDRLNNYVQAKLAAENNRTKSV